MNIAILGATSHIAKGLLYRLLKRGNDHLYLFARSTETNRQFLEILGTSEKDAYTVCKDYSAFPSFPYDLIINRIGVETRNRHNCDFTRYFSVTEEFDNLSIDYLKSRNTDALYISFSSGAVYGRGFTTPVEDGTVNRAALPAIFNPEDLNALELALDIKDKFGRSVTVMAMGLPAASDVLREGLYRGADEAILVTDRRCAASDTLATSYILSCGVKKLNPDIVLCGRQAIDGDTAQVGPQLVDWRSCCVAGRELR